ncbi:MAG: N-acetyltransferase family protein [Anaerolineae bacterium]
MIGIRLFQPAEFEEFRTIRREALVSAPDAFSVKVADFDQRPIAPEKARFISNTSDPNRMIAGAWVDGQISGMIGLFQQSEPGFKHRAMAWGVFSSPNARGLGLGKQMLQLLAKETSKIDGVNQIVLSVLASNTQAIHFYKKIGMEQFTPAGNDPLVDHATTDDEAFMVLHLNSDLSK